MKDLKNAGSKLIKLVRFAGLEPGEYNSILPAIRHKNHEMLIYSSAIGAVTLFCLILTTLFIPPLRKNLASYIVFLCVFLCAFLVAKLVAPKRDTLVMPLFYSLLASAYAFGIIIGTFLQRELPATTLCVLLFALPLLVIDQPYRCGLLVMGATLCFCLCSAACKSPYILSQDLVNSITFMFLSMA